MDIEFSEPMSDHPTPAGATSCDETCAQNIASLFETIGTESFAMALRQFVKSLCPFDSMVVSHFPENAPPVSLYHDLDDIQAAVTVHFYATGPYLLDPLYQACKSGRQPGIVRVLDLVPESFFRSEYYRTFYRSIRVNDEVGVLIKLRGMGWIMLSLALIRTRTRYCVADIERLQAFFPIVSAAVIRNWGTQEIVANSGEQQVVEDKFETFGADVLSPREAEVIRLVLQGHSTPTAAAYLGISEGTVKVHRHHAYTKLGVSSQAELFSMATRHVISPA